MALLTLVLAAATAVPNGVHAREDQPADWELTELRGSVHRLFTPASGAFVAQTESGLVRSDDAGMTWAPAVAGPGPTPILVDPTVHTTFYATDEGGLHRSDDEGTTWRLILAPEPGESVRSIDVSPADHGLAYVILTRANGPYRFLRTRDGGESWADLSPPPSLNSPCVYGVFLLQAHPTDPNRVFRSAGCFAGRDFGAPVLQSTDQGESWSRITPVIGPGYPTRLVGGRGAQPARFYLAAYFGPPGRTWLSRTDDEGQSWTRVLTYDKAADGPLPVIHGLAYDPEEPDRVYAGLRGGGSGVRTSADGGATWTELGNPDIGGVNDLALGVDGLNLYAATDRGLWRLRLR